MAPNPKKMKNKNIGINLKQEIADDLEKRARSMHLTTSAYCKVILTQWLESGKQLSLCEK